MDEGSAYVSPLVERIAVIRAEIFQRARESDWAIDKLQLTDQAIIRRMVLKRCIYGVDKNPLAVELAKVSLWLHSFTVGAPLSFLDHHLRCGDSLLGMRVTEAVDELNRLGGLAAWSAMTGAENAAAGMQRIESLSDADVAEVRESAALFQGVEETTAELRGLLDILCGMRWLTAGMKKQERTLFELPLLETLDQKPVDAFKLLAHGPDAIESQTPVGIAHSRADSNRHLGALGNPSSPDAASSGSAGSHETCAQPASEEGRESADDAGGQASALRRHSRASASLRHSRLRGNPSSSESVDSPASGNPYSPPKMDSRFHGSDDQKPAQPSSGSAGLQPASGGGKESKTRASDQRAATEFATLWRNARTIADRETFLHWEVAFPGVWQKWQDAQPAGGVDAVIGNPPSDRIKLQEVEWFATRAPELARAPTAAARRAEIAALRKQGDPLAADFDDAKARADSLGKLVRASGHYPLLGGGNINLYSLFVENALRLVKTDGLVGLLTPSGIYADKTAAKFFKSVSTRGRVAGLYDFENRKIFFKDVHASFKFCALIVGGTARRFDETACAFFLHDTKTITDADRCFPLAPEDFARVNPNTGTAPVFRTRRDADITRAIYARHPVLVNRSDGGEKKTWPVKYVRMFDMTNDSHLFRTATQLDEEGFYPVQGNRWQRGKELYLPLYQGRMIHQFDHRANSVRVNLESTHNPYLSEEVSELQHANPKFLPQSEYWVPAQNVGSALPLNREYVLGIRHITRPTDARTAITAIAPFSGFGNSIPILTLDEIAMGEPRESREDGIDFRATTLACLVANLNSICLDFITRQKIQGANFNLFIIEQLPVIAPAGYDRQFGQTTALALIRDHVLRLTYTAHDMAPFARDLGYTGPPFIWNEEERRHLRARLDACYFHLYGISRNDAAYILSTFPIVQRQDQATFGTYRTQNLILAYMNALTAGDTKTVVDL
ncbi:MAG: hypothetical protein OXE05_02515 [Chloroflexi bacterium]|nr:hypothetical protein [Chloroflexota bacterium]